LRPPDTIRKFLPAILLAIAGSLSIRVRARLQSCRNRADLFGGFSRCGTIFASVLILLAFATRMSAQNSSAVPRFGNSAVEQGTPKSAGASPYIGSNECRGCHSAVFRSFEQTQHWKINNAAVPPSAHSDKVGSCESCHGPGRDHADSLGDPAKIVSFARLSKKDVAERCLTCHQYSQEHGNFRRSAHRNADVTCLDCHSVHHAEQPRYLLRTSQPQICYGCHAEQKAEFARPFHHRVDEGLIGCTECHNQHGSPLRRQVRSSASQDVVCGKCHTETVGPFVFEHAPQKTNGCMTCHSPHGSPNPRLLKRSNVNQLCLECHSGIGASASLQTPAFHNQDTQFQACTLCHVSIHGSNTDQRFMR
jgi:DmsE family decaheme c-type cytochrome